MPSRFSESQSLLVERSALNLTKHNFLKCKYSSTVNRTGERERITLIRVGNSERVTTKHASWHDHTQACNDAITCDKHARLGLEEGYTLRKPHVTAISQVITSFSGCAFRGPLSISRGERTAITQAEDVLKLNYAEEKNIIQGCQI